MSEEFKDALAKARMDLLRKPKAVFVSTVALMMKQYLDTDVPTAATDGLAIYYNHDFFLSLKREERCTLLAHEAMHPALLHLDPAYEALDHDRLNRAGDYVINLMLTKAGFAPIPKWLYDTKYDGMTTMQVYRLLEEEDEAAAKNGSPVPGIGDWSDIRHVPEDKEETSGGPSKMEKVEAIRQLVASAAQAVQQARADGRDPGDIPADVQEFLDNLFKPKLPMEVHLRRFFNEMDKSDYSWQKPNKRFQPMIMPGLYGKKLGHLAFFFDLSMSVSKADLTRYVTELVNIMRKLKPDMMTVVQFDTEIKSVHKIKSIRDIMNMELRGRGGTCIEPVIDWVEKHKPTAACVFSDGEYVHPSRNPKKTKFLWMIHGYSRDMFHCDFGTTIRFESGEEVI